MTTTKKSRRGGARPGSGAKKTGLRKKWFQIGVIETKLPELGGEEAVKRYLQEKADEL
jgi:hypothetical protein